MNIYRLPTTASAYARAVLTAYPPDYGHFPLPGTDDQRTPNNYGDVVQYAIQDGTRRLAIYLGTYRIAWLY